MNNKNGYILRGYSQIHLQERLQGAQTTSTSIMHVIAQLQWQCSLENSGKASCFSLKLSMLKNNFFKYTAPFY